MSRLDALRLRVVKAPALALAVSLAALLLLIAENLHLLAERMLTIAVH